MSRRKHSGSLSVTDPPRLRPIRQKLLRRGYVGSVIALAAVSIVAVSSAELFRSQHMQMNLLRSRRDRLDASSVAAYWEVEFRQGRVSTGEQVWIDPNTQRSWQVQIRETKKFAADGSETAQIEVDVFPVSDLNRRLATRVIPTLPNASK